MSLRAYLAIVRPANCLMAAAGTLVGILLTLVDTPHDISPWRWVAAALATACIAGFGNILNDLRDVVVDRKAHPDRPLASGALQPETAQSMAIALLILGLLLAFAAGGAVAALFAAAVSILLVLYEMFLKRIGLPGNAAVAIVVALTFVFGAVVTGDHSLLGWKFLLVRPGEPGYLVTQLAKMALFTNLAREVAKDIEDVDADRGHRRTLPMLMGAGGASFFVLVCGVIALGLSAPALSRLAAPLVGGGMRGVATAWPALLLVAASDLVVLAGAFAARKNARQSQRRLKLGMALALAGFAWFAVAKLA